MKLVYAKNPVWANRSQTLINLTVRFEEIAEELPFTANPNDIEEHGRDIYARAAAGEFGSVAPFNAISPTVDSVKEAVRQARNRKLETEVDPIVSNPLRWADLTLEQQQTVADYRIALLNITDNPAFPWYATVVSETDFGFDVDVSKAPWPINPIG
jgi:hypothetical protein